MSDYSRNTDLEHQSSNPDFRAQRQLLGGGYADTPTEEWDIGTAFSGVGRPGYIEEMRHWAQSLLTGKQPEASHEDAYQNMRVLKAISDSVESGEVVSLAQ